MIKPIQLVTHVFAAPNSQDEFGIEAVDTLIKEMEDKRENFVAGGRVGNQSADFVEPG